MAAGEVVGGILLSGDKLLRVEELPVGTGPDLVDHSRLEIEEDAPWDVLSGSSLAEETHEKVLLG